MFRDFVQNSSKYERVEKYIEMRHYQIIKDRQNMFGRKGGVKERFVAQLKEQKINQNKKFNPVIPKSIQSNVVESTVTSRKATRKNHGAK